MGRTCMGCGKPMGGLFGAVGPELFYGEVCLTCNRKLKPIPGYQLLTPEQVKDIVSGRVHKTEIKAPGHIVASSNTHQGTQKSAADELRQYKELLDDGIISQEEFNSVKRRLLKL